MLRINKVYLVFLKGGKDNSEKCHSCLPIKLIQDESVRQTQIHGCVRVRP